MSEYKTVPVVPTLREAESAIARMDADYAELARINASNRIGDALPFKIDNYNAAFEKAGAACIAYVKALAAAPEPQACAVDDATVVSKFTQEYTNRMRRCAVFLESNGGDVVARECADEIDRLRAALRRLAPQAPTAKETDDE